MIVPQIVNSYVTAYNNRDAVALLQCTSSDIVFENVSNSHGTIVVVGQEAFADLVEQAANLFTERTITIRGSVVSGDKVALEIDWTGIPAADFGTFAAGERVNLRGATFLTIENGKLCRIVDIS